MLLFFIILQSVFYLIESEYCEYPLVEYSTLSASSELVTREAYNARLFETTAWTAEDSDYSQFLLIDLREVKNVTKIATQGREDSNAYVIAYTISYGYDGILFSQVKGFDGSIWAFDGNRNGNTPKENIFETPVIARYIKINPTRWRDRISMRVELYGCDYVREVMNFNGNALVVASYEHSPIASLKDNIRFRFRTSQPNGILLYGRGSQGDYLALQLYQNHMILNINLGSDRMTSLSVGSLLDDNSWHDIEIRRNEENITLLVDRVQLDDEVYGDFKRFDLDRKFYFGGSPNIQVGLKARVNFTGCMENLFVNGSSVIPDIKRGRSYYVYPTYEAPNVTYECAYTYSSGQTLTFLTREAHLLYDAYEDQKSVNVSCEFRTFEENGLLIYHKFTSDGFFALYLQNGKVKVDIAAKQTPGIVTLDNFATQYNDGRWHQVEFSVKDNAMELVVDSLPMKVTRIIAIKSGRNFFIAGGPRGYEGFVGCIRLISVRGYFQAPRPQDMKHSQGIVMAACQIIDRCNPNPCEHSGKCKQTTDEFFCDCTGTGYSGAVCHTSLNPVSCAAYGNQNPDTRRTQVYIDIDGSGLLDPFPVTCEFLNDGRVLSVLNHKHLLTTPVDGFSAPGSYIQDITYDANIDQIEVFVNRSTICYQRIHFECLKSRLFNTPVNPDAEFQPYTWWVSRHNRPMDYWGGSLPGSRKCECGLLGKCIVKEHWCNCDAGLDSWVSDGGELRIKEHLPVRQIRVGDTGSPLDGKKARYTIGPLTCEGDNANIELPQFDMGHSGDIYFEFKTTARDGCMVHAKGHQDYIKICVVGGQALQFQYQAGSGPIGVTVETAYPLNDDKWHSVLAERNRKEARVIVDGSRKSSVKEPPGPVRAILLRSNLIVGSTIDYRDGYVGCIRAFMLNGILQDLRGRAEKGMYGVNGGCHGKCQSNPCQNNGTCQEGYSFFDCDCRWTAFKGPICADEIGMKMLTDTMVKYEIPGSYMSTISEKIRVGFTTTNPRGFLIGLVSNVSGEYLTLAVSNSGHLKLTFDFGFERHEKVYRKRTFHEGQNHDVKLERFDSGRKFRLQVDNYEPVVWAFYPKGSADAQFNNIQYVYVGRNESMPEGFFGCISRVQFDDIYPLKLYFQQDRPATIYAVSSAATILEDYCGIEPIRYAEEETETRPPVQISEEIRLEIYADYTPILGGILAIIFLALICMGFLVGRYLARHKGDYQTHEADGAHLAPDADWAVQHSRTGPQVKKNTEMYI